MLIMLNTFLIKIIVPLEICCEVRISKALFIPSNVRYSKVS